MTSAGEYRSGVAVWAAVTSRAKATAKETGVDSAALMRRFVFGRFLARVFHDPAAPWVLKGGTAILARVHDARTTKDVDLLGQLSNLDAAVDALRTSTALDLSDHFRFVVTKVDRTLGGENQPGVNGCRVNIDAYCGTAQKGSFGVDLVTGSLMTGAPELLTDPVLDLRGINAPTMRLYSVVDHIADKLCATQSTYGAAGDQPSSRVRDLVDLVVLASAQDIDGSALIAAIRGEWMHRGLPGVPVFAPPQSWERLYTPLAKKVPACAHATSFEAAVAHIGAFLGPVLDGDATSRLWSAGDHVWQ
ncbi:LOW QUALITY PROTEIN: nucleotidyltransferase AbiEii toxin of type IV toxin-antitoxin system [Sanguibacter antarcticus]|uniref:Nucleotidyltransferase AbiEii toxin of type IV toxin-antitoxin system n=1 Tax=Sanguibacter antarcticus TaxID=372484 RepID=A0A2A9E725_9MICO|nr:LOW QUALITY PROTEIN: nucleotidyltransferase AbiEii toxin of type IV toxin-antitoxin system [Sanguibacter antarcticus]